MKKNFALVIRIFVVVLLSVYFYEYCARQFSGQSENVSEPQLSFQSPAAIQPPNDNPTTDSPTSVPPNDSLNNGDSIAIPAKDSPSTDAPISVPSNDSLTTGSQISVEYVSQANSSQPAFEVKLGVYGNDPSKSQPQTLQSIDWSAYGSLVPGQSVNGSKVYLRNEGEFRLLCLFLLLIGY